MRQPMTITIPGTFDRRLATNAMKGRGWQASHAAKDDLKDRTMWALKEQGGDPGDDWLYEKMPLVLDWVIYYEQRNPDGSFRRKLDADNVAPALKYAQDMIAQFLGVNDRNFVTGKVEQHLWSSHKSEPRIVCTIAAGNWWVRIARPDYEKLCQYMWMYQELSK